MHKWKDIAAAWPAFDPASPKKVKTRNMHKAPG